MISDVVFIILYFCVTGLVSGEESSDGSDSVINQFVELNRKIQNLEKVQIQQQATLDEYEIKMEKFILKLAVKDDEIKSLKKSQDARIARNKANIEKNSLKIQSLTGMFKH